MRRRCLWFFVFSLPLLAARADLPAELAAALANFRAEGSPHWGFTQITAAEDKSLVERYDPTQPGFQRWTLLQKDGRTPTVTELTDYREKLTRRTGGLTAPNVKDQLDRNSAQLVQDDGTRATWRCLLVPGAADDTSARHMDVHFTLHRPTGTIERVVLASFEPFSPVFLVKIAEARTEMHYSLPTPEQPDTLLQKVTMRVRGSAMWFKSLDSDLAVSYEDYVFAGKRVP